MTLGWGLGAATQMKFHWAHNTLILYNRMVLKFKDYCLSHTPCPIDFPPDSSALVAEFLCFMAQDRARPRSVLCNCSAALKCLYEAYDRPNPMDRVELRYLLSGLVKSSTDLPRKRSRVLPMDPFLHLFRSWGDNQVLELRKLRLKCLTLLAFSLMLRPSDVAPNAQVFNSETLTPEKLLFAKNQLDFREDGSLCVRFLGIKNDYDREGFEVVLPASRDLKVDPVGALRCYIERTESIRDSTQAVFLTLVRPYRAISSSTVGKILSESIDLAGLAAQGFSAKSFRPTGATNAIASGIQPDMVRKIGRWKNQEVFESHYVHCNTVLDFTDKVLQSCV